MRLPASEYSTDLINQLINHLYVHHPIVCASPVCVPARWVCTSAFCVSCAVCVSAECVCQRPVGIPVLGSNCVPTDPGMEFLGNQRVFGYAVEYPEGV